MLWPSNPLGGLLWTHSDRSVLGTPELHVVPQVGLSRAGAESPPALLPAVLWMQLRTWMASGLTVPMLGPVQPAIHQHPWVLLSRAAACP